MPLLKAFETAHVDQCGMCGKKPLMGKLEFYVSLIIMVYMGIIGKTWVDMGI